jgi:hypothetical protein
MDQDNDARFPSESLADVRYPRHRQEEPGDRSAWPWLPGSIADQRARRVVRVRGGARDAGSRRRPAGARRHLAG